MMTDEKLEFLERIKEKANPYNPNECRGCGGECCKDQSCMAMPWDINPFTADNIWDVLEKGYYSIRAFFEFGKAYVYLEAREENNGPFAVLTSHSKCSLLNENGCSLSNEERHCENLLDIDEFENKWKDQKVAEVMAEVLKKYIGNNSIEQVCEALFRAFEFSVLNNTTSYNFAAKYMIYHEGLKFGYRFEKGFFDKLFS